MKIFPRAKIKLPKCANSNYFNKIFWFSNCFTIFKLAGHFCPWLDRFQDPFQKFGRHPKFLFWVADDMHVIGSVKILLRDWHQNRHSLVKIWLNSIIMQDCTIENDFWTGVSSKLLEGTVLQTEQSWFFGPDTLDAIH